MYLAIFGPGLTMALPLLFVLIVGTAIVVSARMSNHYPLIYTQLACITWISALIQWSIGSSVDSGLVICWSFLGAIGALMFLPIRQALVWMGMFLAIVGISVGLEPALLGAPLPVSERVRALFLAMNIGTPLLVAFAAAAWFVYSMQREQSRLVDLSHFLKKTFGRFHSDQVLNAIIDDPTAALATGARQPVTILMTDLRGFTALCEQRKAEEIVETLNVYLAVMVDVILAFEGTIHEIIGDALLVTFGAPAPMEDRIERAVACAIRMQNEMTAINEKLEARGLPALHMGIGINDAEVIVGTIGSEKRAKYGIIGSGVNFAARIESYTTGGQVLVSQSVVTEIGDRLRIDGRQELRPKGSETPLVVYDVGGIAGPYQLSLRRAEDPLVEIPQPIDCNATIVRGKVADKLSHPASVTHLSRSAAQIESQARFEDQQTIKLNLVDVPGRLRLCAAYAKVLAQNEGRYDLSFTSVGPELEAYFLAHIRHVAKRSAAPATSPS